MPCTSVATNTCSQMVLNQEHIPTIKFQCYNSINIIFHFKKIQTINAMAVVKHSERNLIGYQYTEPGDVRRYFARRARLTSIVNLNVNRCCMCEFEFACKLWPCNIILRKRRNEIACFYKSLHFLRRLFK